MESMTGFGRAEAGCEGFKISVEVKSLNNRSLSISLKLPEVLSFMEPEVRKAISEMFERGRIRLEAAVEASDNGDSSIAINMESVRFYIDTAELLSKYKECTRGISAGELLRLPGVAQKAEPSMINREELIKVFMSSTGKALAELRESRRREGTALEQLFREGFESISELAAPVLSKQKESVQERYGRLRERICDLLDDVSLDENRLMQELALMADRSDVTEEVQRLKCHLDHAVGMLDSASGSIGRKMEFVIQEMHRELNTAGAKVDDPEQSMNIIEMKNILSSLKEQAANIE